jgi:hypothetical protein
MAQANRHLPFDLDPRDPNFAREMLSWSLQTRCEISELLANATETLATSRALMAQTDRLLARKWC